MRKKNQWFTCRCHLVMSCLENGLGILQRLGSQVIAVQTTIIISQDKRPQQITPEKRIFFKMFATTALLHKVHWGQF